MFNTEVTNTSRDAIILTGMEFLGRHGCSEEERKYLQPFIVDTELSLDLSKAGRSDNISDTVDYVELFKEVKKVVTGESKNLIEALAEDIAQALLRNFVQIESIKVIIHKPEAPVAETFNGASVSIIRDRNSIGDITVE